MRHLRVLLLPLLLLGLSGCAAQAKMVKPDWQNPNHKLVGQQLVPLLRAAGRDPNVCKVGFIESDKINAVSGGECRFAFTNGLANTGDAELIRGIAAHEVAHEILGHADKRKAAIATEQVIRSGVSLIPGVGGLIATGVVLAVGMVALPAYSRSQETDADAKAVEILQSANVSDPAGTMAHTFRVLLAHSGATGGGLLDAHPGTPERLEAMLALQRQQPSPAPTIVATSAPPAETAAPGPPVPGPVSLSIQTGPGAAEAGPEPPRAAFINTAVVVPTPAPARGVITIPDLPPGTSVRDLGQGREAVVVLVYHPGSAYCERVEGYLRQGAHAFADRAAFFRADISTADPALAGPEPQATPMLVVIRGGKEQDRLAGVPARIPGKTPEEGLTDWLTEHLARPVN